MMSQIDEAPYVGPRTFRTGERHLFFGRDREAEDLLALVIAERDRLVLFFAQSGAGKSSLINTCLKPDLKKKGFEVLPVGRVSGELQIENEQSNVFVYNLLLSLDQSEEDPDRFATMTLPDFLDKLAVKQSDEADGEDYYYYDENYLPDKILPRVLIIDQFEEIFTNLKDWKKRRPFFLHLRRAMEADQFLWVVLAMREDYVAALEPHVRLLPGKLRTRYYMQRLETEAALEAIKMPIEGIGRSYQAGVAEKLVAELASIRTKQPDDSIKSIPGQFVEPVQLQVVCLRLWESVKNTTRDQIKWRDLNALAAGRDWSNFVDQALAQFYEDAIATVATETGHDRFLLREWFGTQLITEARTRNLLLETEKGTHGLDNEVVKELQNSFLIRSEVRAGSRWYELVHDRFIDPILQSNARWIERHPLIHDAQEWAKDKDSSKLYRGNRLIEAKADPYAHSEPMASFIKESDAEELKLKEEAERRQRELEKARELAELRKQQADLRQQQADDRAKEARRLRWLSAILLVVLLVAVGAAIFAYNQWQSAQAAEQEAQDQAEQAKAAEQKAQRALEQTLAERSLRVTDWAKNKLQDEQLDTALLFSVEAVNIREDTTTTQVLQTMLEHNPQLTTFLRPPGPYDQIALVSPDGQTLVLVQNNGIIGIWNVANEQPFDLSIPQADHLSSTAFSPSGRQLAIADEDNYIHLWDLDLNQPIGSPFIGHTLPVETMAFSPNEDILASASDDTSIILWQVDTGQPRFPRLTDHTAPVLSVAFSPDGEWLASGDFSGKILLWDLQDPDQELSSLALIGQTSPINSLAFSPDSRTLASGDGSGQIVLWDLRDQDQPLPGPPLINHTGVVNNLTFSPDGQTLASASDDHTIVLWNLDGGQTTGSTLAGHTSPVARVVFSPDSQVLISVSDDGTAILWDISGRQRGQIAVDRAEQVWEMVFAPAAKDSPMSSSGPAAIDDLSLEEQKTLACHIANRNLTWSEWQQLPEHETRLSCPGLPIHPSFVQAGMELARKGEVDNAVVHFQMIQTLDPDRFDFEPKLMVKQLASEGYLERGRALAEAGNVDKALTQFEQALKVKPHSAFNPTIETALSLVKGGENLAAAGDVDNALDRFNRALELAPFFDLNPELKTAEGLVVRGRHLAESGDLMGAIDHFQRAAILNPNLVFIAEAEARRLAGQSFIKRGQQLGSIGDIDGALAEYQRALDLNPNLNGALETGVQMLLDIRTQIKDGRKLAESGEVDEALRLIQDIHHQNPLLYLNPQDEVQRIRDFQELIGQGTVLAQAGQVNDALDKFRQALVKNPDSGLNPEAEVAQVLVDRAVNLVNERKVRDAIAAYDEAQRLDPTALAASPVISWGEECRKGGREGNAAAADAVMPACDRAIELITPDDDKWIYNDRGVARALTGDYEGAAEDFEVFVTWSKEANLYENYGMKREQWLIELEADRNPLDEATLEELRNEE